jgi:hypothetical protein
MMMLMALGPLGKTETGVGENKVCKIRCLFTVLPKSSFRIQNVIAADAEIIQYLKI